MKSLRQEKSLRDHEPYLTFYGNCGQEHRSLTGNSFAEFPHSAGRSRPASTGSVRWIFHSVCHVFGVIARFRSQPHTELPRAAALTGSRTNHKPWYANPASTRARD